MEQATATADHALGPIGDEILYENDAIRVWGLTLDPGAVKALHHHRLPYLIVPLTAGTMEIHGLDGSVVRPDEQVGGVVWREPGEIHDFRNCGTTQYKNILIEVKAPTGTTPGPNRR
jgi:hypothetical protein